MSVVLVRLRRGHDLNLYCEGATFPLSCRKAEMVTDHDTQSVTLRHTVMRRSSGRRGSQGARIWGGV